MERLVWEAYQDDGTTVSRYDTEGREQTPDPWKTRQFHGYTLTAPMISVWLFVPRGSRFRCGCRRALVFYAGWELPDGGGSWLFLSPDGIVELSSSRSHLTRYERS